jgi:hypothetical protein
MNILRIFLLSLMFLPLTLSFQAKYSHAREERYCVATIPCPVLNSPDFRSVFGGTDGKTVKTDKKGLIRALEFIALPGTPFKIISENKNHTHSILEVNTTDYPSDSSLFIDSRFIAFSRERPKQRVKRLPAADKILSSLISMKGNPYMWGGNWNSGIPQMLEFYPPSGPLPPSLISRWRLEGVDCSGLIYQASEGYTPRNTSEMLTFGEAVEIKSLSAEEIAIKTRPLDLIVWKGHVVIVLGENTAIESSHPEGVKTSNLISRLNSIMKTRTAINTWNNKTPTSFVIRRWYPST